MLGNEATLTCASSYQDRHLTVHFNRQMVMLDGASVTLTRKEYDLLVMLSQNAGEIVPRDVLLRQVWGYRDGIRTRTLDVHVRRLRKKLMPFADKYIETIFGVGYRFQPYRVRATSFEMTHPVAVPAIA
jgi:DNA-binding response OmpR family regulator